jgi:dynein heavy chain
MPGFNHKDMLNVSVAAAGLCSWVVAIEKFHHVNKVVAPMQAALKEAEAKHSKVMAGLKVK